MGKLDNFAHQAPNMTRVVLVYQSECCFVIPAIIFNMFKTDQEYKDLAFLPAFLSFVREAGSCSCGAVC